MVPEATMVCIDNSEWMLNGDYSPNRLLAQTEAVKRICVAKTQMNPENTVGVITMAGKGVREWVAPTRDLGNILAFMNGLESGGEMNLDYGIRAALLDLKHGQNKKQQQRIIVFAGSPIQHEKKALELIGKKLKKNSVALDIVNFGKEDEGKTEKLEALLAAVNNNDTSHIVPVPPSPNVLSDVLISTPIFTGDGEGGSGYAAAAAAAGGASAFQFGVDPNLDPDLALALRLSMEEERAGQVAVAKKAAEAATQGKEGEQPSSLQEATITDRVSASTTEAEPKKTDLTDEENALLQKALRMSMDDPAPSNNVQDTTTSEAATDDPGATRRTLQSLKPPCTISAAQSYSVIPTVIDQSSFGERAYDIFSKFLKERIVFINGPINDDTSHLVISQLLLLEFENPTEPIHMYLNSSGGEVTAGLAIYDTMQLIRPSIKTVCIGHAASVASLLVAAGSKGERRSLPNATIMIFQPSGWHSEQTKDLTIHAKQIVRVSNKLSALYTKHTGQSIEIIEKSMYRANFMTSEEAKEFGIIDEVIYQRHSDFKKLGF